MASSSQSHTKDLQRNLVLISSNNEESSLESQDFPSLEESYGVNGLPLANPRSDGSSQMGMVGASNGRNLSNPEVILPGGVDINMNLEKNSTSSQIGAFGEKGSNPNPNSKDWRALFPMPKPVTQQASMKFTAPIKVNGKVVVAAQSEKFSEGMKKCENRVVGFFVGKRLSFPAVQLAVGKLWKFKKEVRIKLHDNCAFIFEFDDEDDRKLVLDTGSFYISKSLFTLRPWSLLLEKSVSDIKSVPIWVLIYGIPLHMWDNEGLGLISSFLGKPLLADDCTIKQERLAYARICVEIDTEFSYPAKIPLLIDGKYAMDLPVEYPWKPPRCEGCMAFGHTSKNCSRKMKKRWTPKKDKLLPLKSLEGVNVSNSVDMNERLTQAINDASGGTNLNLGQSGTVSSSGVETKETSTTSEVGSVARDAVIENVGVVQIPMENVAMGAIIDNKTPSAVMKDGKNSLEKLNMSEGIVMKSHGAGVSALAAANQTTSYIVSSAVAVGGTPGKENETYTPSSYEAANEKDDQAGAWTEVKGKKSTTHLKAKIQLSPKRNPFMVYSDFTEESRFPINKVGTLEKSSSVVSKDRVSSKATTTNEDVDEARDCAMSCEDKELKKKERELHRIKWNGKSPKKDELLGRGQRSQVKKRPP